MIVERTALDFHVVWRRQKDKNFVMAQWGKSYSDAVLKWGSKQVSWGKGKKPYKVQKGIQSFIIRLMDENEQEEHQADRLAAT